MSPTPAKVKRPRKGSARWVVWHLLSGAVLVSARHNSTQPWKHTLTTVGTETEPKRDHAVTAVLIASLTERGILHGALVTEGPYSWNRITYATTPTTEAFADSEEGDA